jgi:hypothetical protein
MNMKTRYLISVWAAIMLLWTGCHDILNKKDLAAVTYEDVWNSEILAGAYLDKLYRDNMPEWNLRFATHSDEQSGGADIKRSELQIGGQSNDNPVENYWRFYEHIYRINILLDNLSGDPGNNNSQLSIERQNEMRAQALFLRSWRYYNMIIRYGGVPYIKSVQDRYTDDLYVFRDKTSDCVRWLCEDLDEAATYLPSEWSSQTDFGRITKGAAMALKVRVLMFWASEICNPSNLAQRWTDAYNASLAARAELEGPGRRALHTNFQTIWATTHTPETVLTTRYKYPVRSHNTEATIRPLEVSQGSLGGNQPFLDLALAFLMKDGKPAGSSIYAPEPLDPTAADERGLFWLNRDPRFEVTILTNGGDFPEGLLNTGLTPNPHGRLYTFNGYHNSSSGSHMYSRKFLQPGKTATEAQTGDLDWIEIRFAEVLLNLAECAAETNRLQEAYDIIRQIRARADIEAGDGNYGLPPIAAMNQQQMIDEVIFERQIELAFEGKRFWDMRRRKLFQKPPFTDNYYMRRLWIQRSPATNPSTVSVRNFINNEFSTPEDIQEKLNTVKYFDYFTTEIQTVDQPWNVIDRVVGFWAIPVEHFERNQNIAQTKGWDLAPGQAEFDPLQ